jgi:hypothetical protein
MSDEPKRWAKAMKTGDKTAAGKVYFSFVTRRCFSGEWRGRGDR